MPEWNLDEPVWTAEDWRQNDLRHLRTDRLNTETAIKSLREKWDAGDNNPEIALALSKFRIQLREINELIKSKSAV